jgi:hypothetical protein
MDSNLLIGPDYPPFILYLESLGLKWERGVFNNLYGIKVILDKGE